MRTLHTDIETYSSIDLLKCGVYKYVEAEDFEILLFAYAFDDEEKTCIDLANFEELPSEVYEALENRAILKVAHNANFERTCIAKYFDIKCDPKHWECTMVRASALGLPMGLAQVAEALGLEEDKQKDKQGKALIQYFSKPCKPTKTNGQRERNLPHHDPAKWELFIKYCLQDVEVEREIRKVLNSYGTWSDAEHKLWAIDQQMNDKGILLDMALIKNILNYNEIDAYTLMEEAKAISGLENPNSPSQIKQWFYEKEGIVLATLIKEAVSELLKDTSISEDARRLLELRQLMAKTSIAKYEAMSRSVCEDNRIRGILQFYGAARTGRWAGRLVQVHNLPQNKLKDIDVARRFAKDNDFESIELIFPGVSFVLSQLIRTSLIAEHEFLVADFSAIEARVLSWLAEEKWRNEVFATHGKIYEASASKMFNVSIEKVSKELRQKGKVSELALGYGGGKAALETMGALKMGIAEEELPSLVNQWRNANKKIVDLWKKVEVAAIECVKTRQTKRVGKVVTFRMKDKILFAKLPNDRELAYFNPKLKEGKFGGLQLSYEGKEEGKNTWGSNTTWGGKLVENITQAVARDCLGEVIIKLSELRLNIKFTVHDEVIIDTSDAERLLPIVLKIMDEELEWAPGLVLGGEGFITKYYKKD